MKYRYIFRILIAASLALGQSTWAWTRPELGTLGQLQNIAGNNPAPQPQGAGAETPQAQAPAAGQGQAAEPQGEIVPIVLYHTNDIHGDIALRDGKPAGAPVLATLLKQERRPFLYLDSGDLFQGTPLGNLTRGAAVVDVLNQIGLDGCCLGNHEFDYGSENCARLIQKAQFPVLCANVESTDPSQTLPGLLKPYFMKIRNGIVIGVFGLTTASMPNLTFGHNQKGLKFNRETDAAAHAVAELRARGADIVVAVSHVGIERYDNKDLNIAEGEIHIAKTVPGIDVILGGHTHTSIAKPVVVSNAQGGQTLITQTRGTLRDVYRLVLSVDAKTKKVVGYDGGPVSLMLDASKGMTPDPAVQALIEGYQAVVEKEMRQPLGSNQVEMPQARNEKLESTIGDWITDVMRRRANADIAVFNTFGVRAGLAAGTLTLGDVYRVLPFDDILVRYSITGAELRKLVERNIKDDILPLQYSGLEYVFDRSKPAGSRLASLNVGGQAVDDGKVYVMASTNFVATVSAEFKGTLVQELQNTFLLLRDLLVEDVRARSPIHIQPDGRVKAL